MPVIGIPWAVAAAIGALAGGGAAIGEDIYTNKENSEAKAQAQQQALQQQQANANQQALTQKEAVSLSSGQAQAQTGGALTDTGFQDFAATLAGYPGYNAATNTSMSPNTAATASAQTTAMNNPSASASPVDMNSILSLLRGGTGTSGNISGGSGSGQIPNPQSYMELSSPFVAP